MAEKEPHYTVTVYVAAPGTQLQKSGGTSAAGHMYYSISDGKHNDSFGFAPKEHGSSSGPGKVYDTDVADYKDPRYARTMEISKDQYDKLKEFGRNPQKHGFDMEYGGLKNSCVDFTWGGLNHAGLHRNFLSRAGEHEDKSFDGDVKPLNNIDEIRSIRAPLPGSDLNKERLNPMPERTWKQRVISSADPPENDRDIASRPESLAQNDIRDGRHPGNRLYCEAIKAIECSPNIQPGTFKGARLEQAAANLVNVSTMGGERQQGGRNEVLERIDFAVFNKQQDGLIAVQGELGNPMSKLAYLHAAQDNSTTLTAASQQVHDTLQRTQAQTVGVGDQSLEKTQGQGNSSIGPRMV